MLRALFYLFDGMNCTLHSNISESEIEPDGAQEFGPISPLFVDCDLYYEGRGPRPGTIYSSFKQDCCTPSLAPFTAPREVSVMQI